MSGSRGISVAWNAWYVSGLPAQVTLDGVFAGDSSWCQEPCSGSTKQSLMWSHQVAYQPA